MGEIKSKAKIENFGDGETWRIRDRQDNVNRLIRRMKVKGVEPKMIAGRREVENHVENGKKPNARKRVKRKQAKTNSCETNNNNNNDSNHRNNNNVNGNGNIEVILDAFALKNGELECCEMAAAATEMGPRQNDDVDNANRTIKKKDSIDNIIDLIVSKSIKRDETLHGLLGEANGRKPLRRSQSYQGKESKKKRSPIEEFKNGRGREEGEQSLIERLENLEKRALIFERGVTKMEKWMTTKENQRLKQRSRCSAASQEFERNMIEVLEENYKDEETLNELKTIERVKPFERTVEKDQLIAAPKADPIIRNSIRKIVLRVSKYSKSRGEPYESVGDTWTRETSQKRVVHSKESLLESGWVIVENKMFSSAERKDEKSKSTERLVEIKRSQEENGVKANAASHGKSQDLPHVTGGKTYCQMCKKKCSGEVLRVQDKYFHINCFKCKACKNSLAQGGFFCKDGDYYCTTDYQKRFGTKCSHCGEYVEGEVVTALGNTYHQKCFTCGRCRQVFPSGERVTYTGKEVLCQKCVQIPVRDTRSPARSPTGPCECAGCGVELKDGQALIALERQWHIWCFKCKDCDSVLHGEYMGKDGVPYCEKDYQKHFGVKCAYCSRFISGKVLQAGDNHHFHPTCARCSKCGDPFGDGEEMYLQGGAIWHPRCGPGPTENGTILNGSSMLENGHCTDTDGEMSRDTRDFDRMSSSAVSEMQFSLRSRTPSLNGSLGSPCNSLSRKYAYHRTGSPGLILREYKSSQQFPEDISRIYTYSYLTEEPSQGYLKRPIDPYDKPPTSPHFHRPSSSHSQRSGKILIKTGSRSGMKVMAESIRSETPRPKSPHMNNEEPIELARIPDAKKPKPGEKPKIERDDFPAPPYPYTDPERRKRLSGSFKGASDEEEDETDAKDQESLADDKLKKEEEELSKIATGIGKVFLQNVKEREKLRQYKLQHLDPRNASRVPSANKEPAYRLRYQSPVNASPSRNMDHPRPWEEDDYMDRSSSYRSSVGRSIGAIPSYNANSSSRLGYVRSPGKASTLPTGRYMSGYCSDYGVGYNGDFSYSGFGEKTHSTEFSSGKSDISGGSISEVDRRVLNTDMPMSTTFQGGLRYSSYSPHLRRSLPTLSHMSNEPPKIYPYHLLVITNYRLPVDVDRCNLERHLSDNEFEQKFQCTRAEFYRMPQWRRNDMKRRLKLF